MSSMRVSEALDMVERVGARAAAHPIVLSADALGRRRRKVALDGGIILAAVPAAAIRVVQDRLRTSSLSRRVCWPEKARAGWMRKRENVACSEEKRNSSDAAT